MPCALKCHARFARAVTHACMRTTALTRMLYRADFFIQKGTYISEGAFVPKTFVVGYFSILRRAVFPSTDAQS